MRLRHGFRRWAHSGLLSLRQTRRAKPHRIKTRRRLGACAVCGAACARARPAPAGGSAVSLLSAVSLMGEPWRPPLVRGRTSQKQQRNLGYCVGTDPLRRSRREVAATVRHRGVRHGRFSGIYHVAMSGEECISLLSSCDTRPGSNRDRNIRAQCTHPRERSMPTTLIITARPSLGGELPPGRCRRARRGLTWQQRQMR